jgi:iron only hydrogenase large subunit-like protein
MVNALISKRNDCRSCYKCIRVCPTKSISFKDGQASIIPEECVLCGSCYLACPQNAKEIRDDLPVAKGLLSSSSHVYASVAPSYLASFPGVSFATFRRALLTLGFAEAEETAIGATIVKKRYDAIVDEGKRDVVISTCCHSINLLVQKHYPEAIPYLADVLSPMLAHGQDIKRRHPEAKVVFIGPCISKKNEIEMYPGYVDCVLTFLELERWLTESRVFIARDPSPKKEEESLARLFPVSGGILDTMEKDNPAFTYLAVSGMEESIAALKDVLEGKVHHAFIEMSACSGSCINGPAIDNSARALIGSYLAVRHSAGAKDFPVEAYSVQALDKRFHAFAIDKTTPTEDEISAVLAKIGKTSKRDELNCSSCGYATCRDKAKAVISGKANLEMCLPFLMEKARSFSNNIVENSANAIIVLSEDLSIQLINPSMCAMLGLTEGKGLIGKPISTVLEPDLFAIALGGMPIKGKKLYLARYSRYVEAGVAYDQQFHIIIGIYRDVTEEEKRRQAEKAMAAKTAKITSEVIEKNMRAVQEIASLLGQSTAETKVALTQLENALKKEDDSDGK